MKGQISSKYDTKMEDGIVVFYAKPDFGEEDLVSILTKISLLLKSAQKRKKPFSFILDVRPVEEIPLSLSIVKSVSSWMSKEKPMIIKNLTSSCVIIGSNLAATLINMCFKVISPSRPNKLVTIKEDAIKFTKSVPVP